ncbi:MAG: tryptophan synthase subunit alpha [Candidatus Micrarchaeia archaeon]
MGSRIKRMFANAKGAAFMPYVCCGDPDASFTISLVKALCGNGADAIEFGIPFSDPIADGKTIQEASNRALAGGMTPSKALGAIARIRRGGVEAPIIAMTYYNIIFSQGQDAFLKKLKQAGADGLIVPDVPLEESAALSKSCKKACIDLVFLVTPNTADGRIAKIARRGKGFLYAVSVLGTTGARKNIDPAALTLVKRASRHGLPVVAGFGISTPAHARRFAAAGAKGVIVGSEIANIYSRQMTKNRINRKTALEKIAKYAREMKSACSHTVRQTPGRSPGHANRDA